jgi:hypothetical protein
MSYVRDVMGTSSFENETVEAFLSIYDDYCSQYLVPKSVNVEELRRTRRLGSSLTCPCVPHSLRKFILL